ncbi:MAG: ATP-binding cassette domain-containing protein [Steroidobacteraceae bacterium]
MLSVRNLVKRYGGRTVVDDVSFAVAAGECFGLLGPNGAGKTTTLRCCLGLTTADSGAITLAEQPVPANARLARYRVGVVPQFDNLDPDFSITENLVVFGRYFGLRAATVRKRVPELLEFAGLGERAGDKLDTLSGGMKRRLTLARALVNDPQVLFMDEPTTGLDPQARHLIWDRLKGLKSEGRTLILTTHFMEEAERLCDRVAILDQGRIIALDSPRALVAKHVDAQVVEVYGEGIEEWAREVAPRYATRVETSGETAFCYCNDDHALLEALHATPQLRALKRPANLEDVFIKLTGREIRD